MAAFIVSYDLRKPQRDYSTLYTRLTAWSALRVLESVYIITSTQSDSATIRDDLAQYIDANDGLLVAKLTGDAAWRQLLPDHQTVKDKLNG